MSASALDASVSLVAYLALFASVGLVFLFVNMLVGRFVRPFNPSPEKSEIYECGEPTIGSSFVQFDLRFYVVALLFIVFDVEVAFFFPWASVFGKANNIAQANEPFIESRQGKLAYTDLGLAVQREIGIAHPTVPTTADVSPELKSLAASLGDDEAARADFLLKQQAQRLAGLSLLDVAVFFGILMLGFAYVWCRGDLDWVRAVGKERAERAENGSRAGAESSPVLSA